MRQQSLTTPPPIRRHRPAPHRAVPLLVMLVGLAIAAAACGGGSPNADPSSTTAPAASGGTTSSGGSATADSVKFAQCMRSHGVSNFPDPTSSSGGAVQFGGSTGINPNSPTVQAAGQACKQYLSAGTASNGNGETEAKDLKLAQCMRSHGLPNFPDPTAAGLELPASINPMSPAFKAAAAACQSLLPKFGG